MTNMKLSFVFLSFLLSSPAECKWWGSGNNNGNGRGNQGSQSNQGAVQTGQVDDDERSTMLFMREEEKMARDVYLTLAETYGDLVVFSNIARSEQTHMDKMEDLLNTYNIEDPVLDERVGVFQNSDLQALYTTLVARGQQSQLEALKVGALIEEIDIDDLDAAILESDQSDIDMIYGNLKRASFNHLRAFVRNIERMGVTYEAQHMSQQEVDEILGN